MKEIVISPWLRWHPVPHYEIAEYIDSNCVRIEWAYSEEEAQEIAQDWQ